MEPFNETLDRIFASITPEQAEALRRRLMGYDLEKRLEERRTMALEMAKTARCPHCQSGVMVVTSSGIIVFSCGYDDDIHSGCKKDKNDCPTNNPR